MARIFISYRHKDSDISAGRLATDLSEIFGADTIFRDIVSLQAGEDFEIALEGELDSCAALIAVIGPSWSTIADEKGRRLLEDPKDWVRIEVSRALARNIRVIPVLISGIMPKEAELPDDLKPLRKRQALELSDRHWPQDLEILAQALEKVPGIDRLVTPPPEPSKILSRRNFLLTAISMAGLALAGWFGWDYWNSSISVKPVDLSQWVRIRDSGTEGSVAGLAVVTAMEASLSQQKRPVSLSARYLYEKAKSLDRFGPNTEGTDIVAALYIAEAYGAPPEDRWPYIAGSTDLPKGMTWEKMDAIAAKFRARTFRLSHLEEIPQQLKQGRPVLAKVELTDAWTTDKAAKSGQISVTGKEKFLGDYVVVIVGFDPADSSIKFANSWGVNWGDNGFGKMSAESARRALKEMWAIEVPPLKN